MKKKIIGFSFLFCSALSQAQLADGSTAPDFTHLDLNGNSVNLYSYLDSGKTVYLDIFAAHCPTCWAYHNTHALRDLYNDHGSTGTVSQDIMVIAIEYDAGNGMNELYGISGITQGDWVTGTPYPILNPEGADRTNFISAYSVSFYPMIYAICPDKKIRYIGTQNESVLYSYVDTCSIMGMYEMNSESVSVYLNNGMLILNGNNLDQLAIADLGGRIILSKTVNDLPIDVTAFSPGIYLFLLTDKAGHKYSGKFFK